jgi:Flp pilus assembly protein TadD
MRMYSAIFMAASVALLGAACCFSQPSPDRQQEEATHLSKANAYIRARQPDMAIPELQAVVAIDPANVDAQGNLGVLLFFQQRFADAVPHLRFAVHAKPDLWKIQGLLGLAESHLQESSASRADLEAAFPHVTEQSFQLELGRALIDNYAVADDLEQAASVVSTLLASHPTDPSLLYISYRLYSDLAGQSMLSLSLAAPDSAQMHAVMAREEARQGNDAAAIAQYNQALAINPKLPGADVELAELMRNAPDVTEQAGAVKIFQAALKVNPFDEKAMCELGDIALQKGDFNEAGTEYSQALKLRPSDPDANFGMAKTLIALNDSEQAASLLEKSIQLDPTNASAHYRMAMLYKKEGRTADARQQLEDYEKLYKLKQKLDALYREMRLQPLTAKEDRETK